MSSSRDIRCRDDSACVDEFPLSVAASVDGFALSAAAACSRCNVTVPGALDRQQIPRLEEDD